MFLSIYKNAEFVFTKTSPSMNYRMIFNYNTGDGVNFATVEVIDANTGVTIKTIPMVTLTDKVTK